MDVEKTVAFYKEVFGLKQVGLGHAGVYLSDGHINLAILKPNRRNKDGTDVVGIDHLGFLVEDVEGTLDRLNQQQEIDISSSGWAGTD
jgi:catechol 2,3-dioxygenase-like lactoylglutathione lyase family enzyme